MSFGRFALHDPLIPFALQHILHRQSGSGDGVSLGLEMHYGGSFILVIADGHHFHVHRYKIGALGEVGHDALLHGIIVLYISPASAEHANGQPKRNAENGKAFHTPIIATVFTPASTRKVSAPCANSWLC